MWNQVLFVSVKKNKLKQTTTRRQRLGSKHRPPDRKSSALTISPPQHRKQVIKYSYIQSFSELQFKLFEKENVQKDLNFILLFLTCKHFNPFNKSNAAIHDFRAIEEHEFRLPYITL